MYGLVTLGGGLTWCRVIVHVDTSGIGGGMCQCDRWW